MLEGFEFEPMPECTQSKNTGMISDFSMIAKKYVKTNFVPDFISCFPIFFHKIYYELNSGDYDSGVKTLVASNIFKLCYIAKLLKIIQLEKIFSDLEAFGTFVKRK